MWIKFMFQTQPAPHFSFCSHFTSLIFALLPAGFWATETTSKEGDDDPDEG